MQCPVDGETLVISERSGVEIDYCPKCRGVWLDRGELDKIIDRADSFDNSRHEERGTKDHDREQHARGRDDYHHRDHDREHYARERDRDRDTKDRDNRDDRDYHSNHYGHKKSRKKSFLSEIFEFGD